MLEIFPCHFVSSLDIYRNLSYKHYIQDNILTYLAQTNLNNLKLTLMKFQSFVELKVVNAPESTDTNGYLEAANTGEIVNLFDEHTLMDKAT